MTRIYYDAREEVIFVSTIDSISFRLWLYLPINLRQFKTLQFNQKLRSSTLSRMMYIFYEAKVAQYRNFST